MPRPYFVKSLRWVSLGLTSCMVLTPATSVMAFTVPAPASPALGTSSSTPASSVAQTPQTQLVPGVPTQPIPGIQYQPGTGLPTAPSGSPPPAPAAVETPYTLGAGDRIRIDLFQAPQYSGEHDLQIDGSLNLPLVGPISVRGQTVEEATATLTRAYSQYLRRPNVTISLIRRRPLQIGIAGEVNRPGTYTIPIAADNPQLPRVTQLLEAAGGITQIADLRQVQIRRPQPNGGEQVINVDLWQLVQTGNLAYDVSLRDGDTIVVPETEVNLAEAPLLNTTSFSADSNQPVNIAVVGEVYRPGTYTVTGGVTRTPEAGVAGQASGAVTTPPTVTRAIQVAGGIKPLADIRRVQVRRLTRSAGEQVFEVDLWALLQQGDARQDAILQPGDTIVIPAVPDDIDAATATQLAAASFSPDKIQVNVVGEVTRPGTVEVAPNTPLNQAILAAGGFNERARESRVQLVRLNPDGTVSRQEIPVDFSQGIDAANNPTLRNNDIVIVSPSDLANVSDTIGSILSPLQGIFSILGLPFQFLRIFR